MSLSQRQMAAIRFLALPESERGFPSINAFAAAHDITDRTIRRWQQDEEFAAELERVKESAAGDDRYADTLRFEAAKDRLFHIMQSGETTQSRQAAKDLANLTKDSVNSGQQVSHEQMTDTELVAAMLGAKITLDGIDDPEFAALCEQVKGAVWNSSSDSSSAA